jgi:hypothetical protein
MDNGAKRASQSLDNCCRTYPLIQMASYLRRDDSPRA